MTTTKKVSRFMQLENPTMAGDDVQTIIANALMKIEKKMKRVCIFIDNSNLFWALKNLETEKRLDYIKLRDLLADDRTCDVRFYYSEPQSINSRDEEAQQKLVKQRGFYTFLEKRANYHMVKLPLRERYVHDSYGETQQVGLEKGLDCEIVWDMCSLSASGRYDAFILVAGDEDYARSVQKIKNKGIDVEVAFFSGSRISQTLISEASKFIDLTEHNDQLFESRFSN